MSDSASHRPIRALAIETSGRIGSVALSEDGRVLDEETFPYGLQHAARIVCAIDDLCRRVGWTSADLREIYISAGPGSFTGLRIGITLAKTLAFATGAALVSVPSLAVLVENAPGDARRVIVLLDAKREQVFTAAFEREGEVWIEREPAHLGSLSEMLARTARPVHLLGEGIVQHRKYISADDSEVRIVDESFWRPQAGVVARLGWQLAREGRFIEPLKLVPIYIRRPEAEEKYDLAQRGRSEGPTNAGTGMHRK